jgi:hypothetical protein
MRRAMRCGNGVDEVNVWTDLCGDNTKGMGQLRRHYGRRVRAWQRCWGEAECKRANRKRANRKDRSAWWRY